MKKTGFLIFLGSILLIVLAFLFRENLAQFRSFGLLGIFLINFFGSATILIPAPAIASVVAGGAVYPPVLVAVASSLGAALGDMVGFFLGHSGRKIFIKNNHRFYILLSDLFHKFGGIAIFGFAFLPNPFFDIVGISAGVFSYPAFRFFVLLFAGRLLRNLLLASLGSLF